MSKLRTVFCRAVDVIGAIDLVFIVVACFVQVIYRYFFKKSFFWVEEASIYLMIWFAFLGAAKATATQENTRLGFLVGLLPGKLCDAVKIFAHLLTCIFLAFMICYGGQLTIALIPRYSVAVKVSMSLIYGAVPVSGVFMLLFTLLAMIETIQSALKNGGSLKREAGPE